MSHVTLYGFPDHGRAVRLTEFPNNHRGAPLLWNALARWYGLVGPGESIIGAGKEKHDALWALAQDPAVPRAHRLALRMTFDRVILRPAHYRVMARALGSTSTDIRFGFPTRRPIREQYGDPGHLPEWARVLEVCAELNAPTRGLAWDHCSAIDSFWSVQEGEDDWRPYDLDRDLRHHYVEAV